MDPGPKITLSNFVFWITNANDILPPTSKLKIAFARNGEGFNLNSLMMSSASCWKSVEMCLVLPASGILVVDLIQTGYPVTELEDKTVARKLGSVFVDLEELYDISDDDCNPETQIVCMSGTALHAGWTTTVVMETDYLPIMQCGVAVTRFPSRPLQVGNRQGPLYLPFQICGEETSDEDFKRYAEEFERLFGASDGEILLIITAKQFRKIENRCLSMRSHHDQIHLIVLFAGLLNDQFLLRSRTQTPFLVKHEAGLPERQMYLFSRDLFDDYGGLVGGLEDPMQNDFSLGLSNLLPLPDTSPVKILCIQSYGAFLSQRFLSTRDRKTLTQAIFFLERAEQLWLHTPHARDFILDQHSLYVSLHNAYIFRYKLSHNVPDIDKALVFTDKAMKLSPPWWLLPEQRFGVMVGKADALAARYDLLRDPRDVDRAKKHACKALALIPRENPLYVAFLRAFAETLIKQCHMDEAADLELAILRHEELIALIPSGDLTLLKATFDLATLYSFAGNFERAIKLGRDFVDANPSHPDIDEILVNLGSNLMRQFLHSYSHGFTEAKPPSLLSLEDRRDLEEAITLLSRVSKVYPPHGFLAHALFLRYQFGGNHLSDLRASISITSSAAISPVLSPIERYKAADMWSRYAENLSGDEFHLNGMEAHRTVMSLIPSVVSMGMGMQDRHDMLSMSWFSAKPFQAVPKDKRSVRTSIGQNPNRSVAFAISHGEYRTAIEWLEQGRSIIWDQMLQLRVSLESLQLVDKQLAERLGVIGKELAMSTARTGFWVTRVDDAGNEHEVSLEDEGQRHRRLTHEWETGIAEARRIPCFEEFLSSKTFAYLSRAADDCAVVVINTHDMTGTDALVLFPPGIDGPNTNILHVPLCKSDLFERIEGMQTELIALTRSSSSSPERVPKWFPTPDRIDANARFEFILAGLWYEIVLPILVLCNKARPDLFSGSPGVARPRVRWCPTGPLSFLPLHAAGDYTASHTGHKVYDFVISSYIPTLSSIIRDNPTSHTYVDGRKPKILAVCCATPKGYPPIIGTQAELGKIKKHADLAGCNFTAVIEQDASVDRILEEIKDAHWVHFACHGVQNTKSPTQSALILQNGTRATLSDFAALDLPDAELAYLSACQTAAGYDMVPSESIHLAAGMLLAGFRSVIATMWPIEDRSAPDVADSVYGYLLRGEQGSTPDHKESAVALDLAVQRLRKKVGEDNFLSWVPYIHIGA